MKYAILLLVLAAGLAQPFQVAMHAKLAKVGGSPFLAAVVSLLGGAILAAIGWAAGLGGRGSVSGLSTAPWWAFLPGVIGVLIVVAGLSAIDLAGAALVIAILVFGQLASSLAVDHYGWLEVKRQPINAWRIGGAVAVFAGVLMMQKK